MSGPRPRGRPRGRGGARGGKTTTGSKRAAPADSDVEFAPPKPAKKAKAPAAPVVPRSLPARDKRAVNPGLPDKARQKRTHEEVVAEAAKKSDAITDREARRQAAIALLADIDAEQDEADADEEENAIFTLDDLPSDDSMDVDAATFDEDEPILKISQQDFDHIEDEDAGRFEDDDTYQSASEYDKPKPKPKAAPLTVTKRVKKPLKGETRAAIEAAAKEKKAANVEAKNLKKGVQNRRAGLTKAWKNKAATNASKAPAPTPVSPKLGGLTDEDAGAARPSFEPSTTTPRKNEMVTYDISSDTEESPSKIPEVKPKIKIQPKPRLSKPKIPALIVAGNRPTPKIKSESSGSFTPDSADIKGLPGFIGGTWSTLFLPACYRAMYLSDDPMAIGAVGDDLLNPGKETVAILDGILKAVYPGNTWALAWGDPICTKAVSRIGERRSAFGRTALQAVDRVFASSRYFHGLDSPTPGVAKKALIASDVRYALQQNGPAFYKQPSPEDVVKLKPKQAGYVKPLGYLETKLIIDTMSPFIKDEDFSVVVTETPDGKEIIDLARSVLPTGALGLTALGIERGYRMHRSGVRVAKDKVPTFSSTNFGPALAGFIKGIGEFKVSRWESIIKSCGALIVDVADTPSFDPDFEMDSLDGVREHMYIASSPTA
ncbi:hypothetical protein C8R44DRAFT_859590 [Mycena epipterygia]|nr:hypothetical protein C8R44DRAFT_859590 [Mycena epipterygia]